jgi:hypothetical protein
MSTTLLKYLSLAAFILFSFTSCEKNEDPILDFQVYRSDLYGPAPEFTPTGTPQQRVLLEDFTGHDCGFCPNGHIRAAELAETYQEDFAVVAIHAGSLAAPLPPDYPNDWRTPESEYYYSTQVGDPGMPTGRINRRINAADVFTPSQWLTQVTAAFNERPKANVQVKANLEESGGHWNVHAFAEWLENGSGDYRLVILLTESGILAPQKFSNNIPEYIPQYQHDHMLRASGTGATGLEVFNDPIEGTNKRFSYTFDWNEQWVPENCEVIAFLTEGDNGKVVNVAKTKLVP